MIRALPARAPGDDTRQLADHRRVIDEIVRDPFINSRTVTVNLVDAVAARIRHGLGRPFTNYFMSAPQGATTSGRIVESAGDDGTELVLTATGYGATITLRITIF